MILLNPGPVSLTQRVRMALNKPDLCHREPEFTALQERVRKNLLRVYALEPEDWTAVVLTGSGTAAVEAMVSSLVPQDGRVLVVENGAYGERMQQICEIYGIPHDHYARSWGEELEWDLLATRIAQGGLTHVAVVHHETSTGRLNDLARLGALCAANDVMLLVDAVSSFGAEDLDFQACGIAACAGTANKCLHGVPGVSFVIVDRDSLARAARRNLYLDLAGYAKAQDAGTTPFTQSIQVFYALEEALQELFNEGGQPDRLARYRELQAIVRAGLVALGIEPLLEEGEISAVLAAYFLPKGITYARLHDHLKGEGFVIYAGQGHMARTFFRISTMGAVLDEDVERLVAAVASLLNR